MFAGFEDSVLISYKEGRTGIAYCDNEEKPASAVICAGDFYFCAGDASAAAEVFALAENNSEGSESKQDVQTLHMLKGRERAGDIRKDDLLSRGSRGAQISLPRWVIQHPKALSAKSA